MKLMSLGIAQQLCSQFFFFFFFQVCVVMTEGRSSDSVSNPARALRKAGAEIIFFGLGVRYNIRQLK